MFEIKEWIPFFVTDDVVVAVSNSGLVKVWTIHDANDARLVRITPI